MRNLANANFNFSSVATEKINPYQGKKLESMEEMKTKAGLTKVIMESYDYVLEAIKGLNDAQLAENVKNGSARNVP